MRLHQHGNRICCFLKRSTKRELSGLSKLKVQLKILFWCTSPQYIHNADVPYFASHFPQSSPVHCRMLLLLVALYISDCMRKLHEREIYYCTEYYNYYL